MAAPKIKEMDFVGSADFREKFSDTFCKSSLATAPLVMLSNSDDETGLIQGIGIVNGTSGFATSKVTMPIADIIQGKIQLDYSIPQACVVNIIHSPEFNGYIGNLSRVVRTHGVPRRAPKLGFNFNVYIPDMLEYILEGKRNGLGPEGEILNFATNDDQMGLYWDILYPTYYGYNEALDLLLTGKRLACALSEYLVFKVTARHDVIIVQYMDMLLGYIHPNNVHSPVIKPELISFWKKGSKSVPDVPPIRGEI